MIEPQAALDFLTSPRARALILERFAGRSCIASTRVALEVLRPLGVECWPQAVKVEALNERAIAAQLAGTPGALGTFALGVEGTGRYEFKPDGRGDWDGHLVLVFRDTMPGEVLLDLSADQMHRPQHGLLIDGPVAFRMGAGWPAGIRLEAGGLLAYDRIKSKGYRQARDWTLRERWGPTVDRIRAELEAAA